LRAAMSALVALLAVSGCGDREADNAPKADTTRTADTSGGADTSVSAQLPAGRFQIPTAHTPVPDLFITLPDGYTIRNVSRMPDDQFFIFRTDDPSQTDSTAITPGFMRVYVGVNPQTGLGSGQKHTEQNVMVSGFPLVWKLWTEKIPDGSDYYLREISSPDFFASISPELAKAPLNLHLYIAGRDSAQVADLMLAAQTLSSHP
jgi:hypothetical protein